MYKATGAEFRATASAAISLKTSVYTSIIAFVSYEVRDRLLFSCFAFATFTPPKLKIMGGAYALYFIQNDNC